MRVLLKKEDSSLCCMELTKASYDREAQELTLENMEEAVVVPNVSAASAHVLIIQLYQEGQADLSDYVSDC